MDTKTKVGFIAGGIAAATGITLAFSQLGKPEMTYEDDLLNGAAAYVEHYEGNKPAEALQYMLQTIDAVEQSNFKIEGISQLERNVSEIMGEVVYLGDYKNPPTLYHAALEETAEQARAVVEENTLSLKPKIAGAITFSAGATLLALSFLSYRKKKTTP